MELGRTLQHVIDSVMRGASRNTIGCRAAASPDRGTERFLREVMALCGECRLWLLGAPDDSAARARWQAWLTDAGLDALGAAEAPEAVMHGWA